MRVMARWRRRNVAAGGMLALGRGAVERYGAQRMFPHRLASIFACIILGIGITLAGVGCSTAPHDAVPRRLLAQLEERSQDASTLGMTMRGSEVDVRVEQTGNRGVLAVEMKHLLGLPAMTLHVNEEPVTVAVDTGSQGCLVLDAATAVKVNLDVLRHEPDKFKLEGTMGSEPAILAQARRVEVGSWRMQGLPCLVRTHRSMSGGRFNRRHVTLDVGGMALLLQSCTYLTLDYPANKILFGFDQSYQPVRGTHAWKSPLTLRDGLPYVQVSSRGVRWEALLDTGANSALEITRDAARRAGLLEYVREIEGERFGVGVSQSSTRDRIQVVTLPEVSGIGPAMQDIPAFVVSDGAKVGSAFLSPYRVTLDFRKNVVWLESGAKSR